MGRRSSSNARADARGTKKPSWRTSARACVYALASIVVVACACATARARARGIDGIPREASARARAGTAESENTCAPADVCVFSPASYERVMTTLPRLASTWHGTISIAVLLDVAREPRRVLELAQMARDVQGRERVVITIVEELEEFRRPGEPRFPVNMLRNVAREACVHRLGATYVLTHDIDFEIFPNAPSEGLLRDIAQTLRPEFSRRAIVVPAFELHGVFASRLNAKRDAIIHARKSSSNSNFDVDIDAIIDRHVGGNRSSSSFRNMMALYETLVERDAQKSSAPERRALNLTLPYSTKDRLRRLVDERRLAGGFQLKYFPIAHQPTNYSKWFTNDTDSAPYRVAERKHPWYYEPYLIVRAEESLPFDESFVTYGFNKISFAHELSAAGFEFYVTKNAWTVHTNVHQSRAMENAVGKDLERCRRRPARSHDFRIARVGHSCIPAFIRRLECAYGFTLDGVEFNGDPNAPPPHDLKFRLASDNNIVCFGGCITDLEPASRTPGTVTIRGGRFIDVTQGSDARRRKRGLCERLDSILE